MLLEVASNKHCLQLAKLYEKKSVPISCPAVFGGKSWAQVVLLTGFSDSFCFTSGSGSPFSDTSDLKDGLLSVLVDNSFLDACLASLKQSLKLLTDQVSGIVHKLSNIELVLQALSPFFKVLGTLIAAKEDLALDMIVDGPELVLLFSFSAFPSVSTLGLCSSKVLMTKIGSLESKLVALEASVGLVLAKLDYLCAGMGPLLSSLSQ
ncbi:hypothetical protein G9A89_004599 [Geosiphon pyriformis]|nr:hypothetical protein G9A89_004599 [Geosiphon pyriformis]